MDFTDEKGQTPLPTNKAFQLKKTQSAWRNGRKVYFVLALIVLTAISLGRHLDFLPSYSCHRKLSAHDVLEHARLVDGHNDWAIWARAFWNNHINFDNFTEDATLFGQVDFPRLKAGQLKGQFWSVYVECPSNARPDHSEDYFEAVSQTLQQIDLVHRLAEQFPSRLFLADNIKNFNAEPLSSGRISGFLGVEGLHQIGNSAANLRLYHRLGVRYVTLTHTCNNKYADSEEPEPLHNGLSAAGKELLLEMNRMGMAIDLSHTSADTMRDALAVTKAPIMFSHSGAYSVFNHTRNVPDDVLKLVKSNNGVVMPTFYPGFLTEDGKNATLQDVVDHILYIRELIGYSHIGIGSDFDGMPGGPIGLEDVSKYPNLVEALIQHDLPRNEIEAIIGGNVMRVMRDIERVASTLTDQLPLEDDLPSFFYNATKLYI